jgi:hypothetical protein
MSMSILKKKKKDFKYNLNINNRVKYLNKLIKQFKEIGLLILNLNNII